MRERDRSNEKRSDGVYTAQGMDPGPIEYVSQLAERDKKMNRKTHKSAPKTERTAAGKPNAQYEELVFISAKSNGAIDSITQPTTMGESSKNSYGDWTAVKSNCELTDQDDAWDPSNSQAD